MPSKGALPRISSSIFKTSCSRNLLSRGLTHWLAIVASQTGASSVSLLPPLWSERVGQRATAGNVKCARRWVFPVSGNHIAPGGNASSNDGANRGDSLVDLRRRVEQRGRKPD